MMKNRPTYEELMLLLEMTLPVVNEQAHTLIVAGDSGDARDAADLAAKIRAALDRVETADADDDYKAWKNGNSIGYGEFAIRPSQDFGIGPHPKPGYQGWVVVRDGCNPMPGATFGRTQKQALQLCDVWVAVGGEDLPPLDFSKESRDAHAKFGQRFWGLLRAIQRATGEVK